MQKIFNIKSYMKFENLILRGQNQKSTVNSSSSNGSSLLQIKNKNTYQIIDSKEQKRFKKILSLPNNIYLQMLSRSSNQHLCFAQRQCICVCVVNPSNSIIQPESSSKCISTSTYTNYGQRFPLIETTGYLESPQIVHKRHDSFVSSDGVRDLNSIFGISDGHLGQVFNGESLVIQHFSVRQNSFIFLILLFIFRQFTLESKILAIYNLLKKNALYALNILYLR